MVHAGLQLGAILENYGLVSREQVAAALEHQGRSGCRLGESLVALGICPEAEVSRALAEQNGIGFLDLLQHPPSREALRRLPREVAIEYGIIPVRLDGRRLAVVARDPYDLRIDEVVRRASGMGVIVYAGVDSQVRDHLSRYDELKWGVPSVPSGPSAPNAQETAPAATRGESWDVTLLDQTADSATDRDAGPTGRKLDSLIAEALDRRATELIFEPETDGLRVRCRIDGRYHWLTTLPSFRAQGVMRRLQAMAGIEPLPGALSACAPCSLRVEGRTLAGHVSTYLSANGLAGCLRIGAGDDAPRPMASLGLEPGQVKALRQALAARRGVLLIAGPAGSGVPTTLRSLRAELEAAGLTVAALESTFERRLRGLGEVIRGDGSSHSFADALEAALEGKPDALVVGELPDSEAAAIASRAAATGTLVIAACHAADETGAIAWWRGLGADEATLSLVVAQRLARCNCEACAAPHEPAGELEEALARALELSERAAYRKGSGCAACGRLGTRGQIGIFSLRSGAGSEPEGVGDGLERAAHLKARRGMIAPDEIPALGLRTAMLLAEAGVVMEAPAVPLLEVEAERKRPAAHAGTPEPSDWDVVAF